MNSSEQNAAFPLRRLRILPLVYSIRHIFTHSFFHSFLHPASAKSSLIHSFLLHLAIFIGADSGPGTVPSAKYIQYRREQGKALLPWAVILVTGTK